MHYSACVKFKIFVFVLLTISHIIDKIFEGLMFLLHVDIWIRFAK